MRRLFLACAIGMLLVGAASAAPYELIPASVSHGAIYTDERLYWAYLLDNSNGKVFLCSVAYKSESELVSHCQDDTSRFKSKLAPSDAIVSRIFFSSYEFKLSLPAGGLWQIDSKTGDAQFCIVSPRDIKVVGDRCLKLEWKVSQ